MAPKDSPSDFVVRLAGLSPDTQAQLVRERDEQWRDAYAAEVAPSALDRMRNGLATGALEAAAGGIRALYTRTVAAWQRRGRG